MSDGNARRTAGLSASAARLLEDAGRHLDRRDLAAAEPLLRGALALAPSHPEALRLWSVACVLGGRPRDAVDALHAALAARPHDALLHNNLGSALRAVGDADGALAAFRRAVELAPALAPAWFNLGKALKALARSAEADEALSRAVELAPSHVPARIVRADNLKALGRIGDAESAYREALRHRPDAAYAWWGLANLKTVAFDARDTAELERLFAETAPGREDRAALGFALAKALEDQDRYADAFEVLREANAERRRQQPWDAAEFSRYVDRVDAAFAQVRAAGGERGAEVVFIVSLPRSGSTLAEQILAAHPLVEGAGELGDLSIVLDAESRRRGAAFPDWAAQASAADWARLGEEYLSRTARWRERKPRFTDKSLHNWPLVGAAAAMLPGALFVHCRRDPVETALSCWRQWFAEGQAFSYDLEDIAAYRRDHERLMRAWAERLPGRVHVHEHEALLADPERAVRALLGFCALDYDPACLEFHRESRSVRTASAAQVRRPLQQDAGRAARYGDLLLPLRRALGAG